MRKLFATFLFGLISLASPLPATPGKIAVIVNDWLISASELDQRIKLAMVSSGMPDTQDVREKLRDQILNAMIEEALQLQVAKKYEIKVSDAEIEHALSDIEHRNNMEPGQLKKVLEASKIPAEILKNHLKAGIAWREYIRGRFGQTVQVSDQEINLAEEQFNRSKDKEQFLVAEIVIRVDDRISEEAAESKARQLLDQVKQGGHFVAIAQQFSDAPTASKGGDMGWVSPEQLDPSIASTLAQMLPGQISDPVRTPDGYHILFLRDHKNAGDVAGKDTLYTFTQVVFPVQPPFTEERVKPLFYKAKQIAGNAKSCGLLSTLAKSVSGAQTRTVTKARASELVPQLRSLLNTLEEGESSDPVLSDIGVLLFMVCEKEEHNPNQPSREDFSNQLMEQKLSLIAQRELRNQRRIAQIEIKI